MHWLYYMHFKNAIYVIVQKRIAVKFKSLYGQNIYGVYSLKTQQKFLQKGYFASLKAYFAKYTNRIEYTLLPHFVQ